MNKEITVGEAREETTSEIETGQQAEAVGASIPCRTEKSAPKFNRYIYDNLIHNIEGAIQFWNRRADRETNLQAAQAWRLKIDGLGYAIRLLNAFKPEFDELVECADTLKCMGCGADLEHRAYRLPTDSDLCDSCYEIVHDAENNPSENTRDHEPCYSFAAE